MHIGQANWISPSQLQVYLHLNESGLINTSRNPVKHTLPTAHRGLAEPNKSAAVSADVPSYVLAVWAGNRSVDKKSAARRGDRLVTVAPCESNLVVGQDNAVRESAGSSASDADATKSVRTCGGTTSIETVCTTIKSDRQA